jgi:hypothetical protein
MDKKQIEVLKTKVEQMKKKANILKVANLEGEVFSLNIVSASKVEGKYGQQLMIVGTDEEGKDTRLYLTGKREETFTAAYTGEGSYAFVFGSKVALESGHSYIPLELVERLD